MCWINNLLSILEDPTFATDDFHINKYLIFTLINTYFIKIMKKKQKIPIKFELESEKKNLFKFQNQEIERNS